MGLVANLNRLRFGQRVSQEAEEMLGRGRDARPIDRERLEELPPPVRRYLEKAIGSRQTAVRTVRLRHGGTFRMKLDGGWSPIRGEQYFVTDPPSFIWWGHIAPVPGLWFDVRDRSLDGAGNMRAQVESTFTVVDSSGPGIDQGALLRILGEMVWFPTSFLDDRHVAWNALDDRRARATLRVAGQEVDCIFEFGDDGLPVKVSADRYRDVDGSAVLTPWSGEFSDFREVSGMLVPHHLVPYWHVGGEDIPYARFQVDRLEYDKTTAFRR